MSEDSDADWEPQSQTGRPPAPTPTEGGRQKCQRSHSAATSATSPAASSTATPTTGRSRAARRVRGSSLIFHILLLAQVIIVYNSILQNNKILV